MKICLITKECFPFSYGGIGSAFYFLGRRLSDLNHEVVILTKKPSNYEQGLYDQYYTTTLQTEWVNFQDGAFSPHAVLDYSFQLAAHFDSFNASYQADIAIYPEFDGDAFFLVRAKNEGGKHRNTAFAIHYSGPLFCLYEAEKLAPSSYEKIIFQLEECCIRESGFSIAPSAFIRDTLKEKFGLGWQSNAPLPNPVNPAFLSRPAPSAGRGSESQKNIVFVGRLHKIKGTDHLIKAFQTILENGYTGEVRLQLIGKDVYWEEYQMKFIDYWKSRLPPDILSRVDFIGHLSQSEIVEYLQKAWVAVFPSRFEVFGNVAMEALCCGAPILVNEKTGLSEVAGPDYGLSWNGDPETLAPQLLTILRDAGLRDKLAARSLKRAEELQAGLPAAISGLLEEIIIHGDRASLQEPVPGADKNLFTLLNQYSAERLQEKNHEISSAYDLKDEELKKAWAAYDKKDEEIRSIWEKYDEKDLEMARVWKKHDEQEAELEQVKLELSKIAEGILLPRTNTGDANGLSAGTPIKPEGSSRQLPEIAFLCNQIDALHNKHILNTREIDLLNASLNEKESILHNLDRDLGKTVSALISVRDTNGRLQKINHEQEKRIHLLWSDLQHQQDELEHLKNELDLHKTSFEKKEKEISDLYIQLSAWQKELNTIKGSRSYYLSQRLENRAWASKIIEVLLKKQT